MENLQNLMDSIAEWSDKQFGEGRSPVPILHHLKKEVPELIEQLEKYQAMGLRDGGARDDAMVDSFYEFADCFMLILDAARCFGINAHILKEYTRLKLDINKAREWGEPDENGVVEHVR